MDAWGLEVYPDTLLDIKYFMDRKKLAKIVLFVIGIILLALGLFNVGGDILRSFHSGAQTTTFMVRTPWVLLAVSGAILCVISFFIGRKEG